MRRRIPDGHKPVTPHQHHRAIAQRFRKRIAQLVVANQHIRHAGNVPNFKYRRPCAQKSTHMINRAKRRAGHGVWNDLRGMAVDDGHDIGPRAINGRVNVPLDINGFPARVHRLSILVKFKNVAGRNQSRRHAAGHKKMTRIKVAAHADVPKAIEHFMVNQDMVGINEVFDKHCVACRGIRPRGLPCQRG